MFNIKLSDSDVSPVTPDGPEKCWSNIQTFKTLSVTWALRVRQEGGRHGEVLHGDDGGGGGRAGQDLSYLRSALRRPRAAADTVAGDRVTGAPEEAVVVEDSVSLIEPGVELTTLSVPADCLTIRLCGHFFLQ